MNARKQAILAGLLAATDAAKTSTAPSGYGVGMARARWQDAQAGFIPVDAGRWTGRGGSASESAMNSKAYKSLEADGLVERHNLTGGTVTTHLRLTDAGRIAAQSLVDGKYGFRATGAPPKATDRDAIESKDPTSVSEGAADA